MEGVVAGLVMVLSALAGFGPGKTARAVPAVYVLGDSSLDVGNNNYLPGNSVPRANKPFHGVDFPGPGGPRPTGRFSNGYNVADYVHCKESGVREEPSGLSVAEIASSSHPDCSAERSKLCFCRSWDSRFNERRKQHPVVEAGPILPFDKSGDGGQAGLRRGDRPARRILLPHWHRQQRPDTVRDSAAGQEQVGGTERRSRALRQPNLQLLRHHHATIFCFSNLYMMGARKIGVINAGLSGCLPMARAHHATGACNDGANELAAGFNGALESFLADLAPRLPGLAYSIADGFAHRQVLIADPQAAGFVSATSACCGSGRLGGEAGCLPTSNICSDRDGYIYWDWVHATQRAAKMAAQAFFHGPAQFAMPLTFKQLAEKKGADLMEQ